MFKMKSALYIVAIFSLALVACTERIQSPEMPDVSNGATTMVTALVKPLVVEGVEGVGYYKWDSETKIGILSAGENQCYLPVQSTTGDDEAYFYGNVVGGNLTIYSPYSNENGTKAKSGRLEMLAEQTYYANALDHLMYNSTFLATTSTDHVEFDYYAGLLKVVINHEKTEAISSVSISVGNINNAEGQYNDYFVGDYSVVSNLLDDENHRSNSVKVNFKENEFKSANENPIWVALAPGKYENLIVAVSYSDGVSIVLPVEGPFEVKAKALCEKVCVAEKVDHNNGVDDFVGKEDQFDQDKE